MKGTSPVLADTDRDGVRDDVDRAPLGDAFVEVEIDSTYVSGSDAHNTGSVPLPFVAATIQGNTTYTQRLDSRSGTWYTTDYVTLNSYLGHRFVANVPDAGSLVSIVIQMWSYDSRGQNQHTPIIAGSHTEYTGGQGYCVDDTTVTITYSLQAAGQSTAYQLRGCAGSSLHASPLNVTVSTIVPRRVTTDLIVPADYSGIYNVTNASGGLVGRRYVGEPRFVTILLNATTYDPVCHDYCGPPIPMSFLIPRSVFFDTELYRRLNASNPTPPLDKLTFRQNDTSAQANSDSIQEILTGNVTMGDWVSILFLLEDNATNVPVRTALRLTNNLLLYSLPDHAVRFIAYAPPLTAPSTTYTFCTGQCGPPTAKPWWEQVWTGLLIVAAVLSAVILPINAFLFLVRVLVQVGNWLWDNIVGPGIAVVKSAVQAAGEVLNQFVDWIVKSVETLVNAFLNSIVAPLVGSFANLLDAITLIALTVQKPGKGSVMSTEFSAAYEGFVIALASLLLLISTFQLLLLAVDVGLTGLSLTGFGSVVMVAAEIAVTVAFAVAASQLVAAIETVFLERLSLALAFSALVLAIVGTFVAVVSALSELWTESTYSVVRNDFRAVYGELVDQVKIKPVTTLETRRVYSQTAGSGIAILLAVVALFFVSLQIALMASIADNLTRAIAILMLDAIAIVLAVKAVFEAAKLSSITSLSRWSKGLAPLSLGVASAAFAVDLLIYQRLANPSN